MRCCAFGCNNNTNGKPCTTTGPHAFFRFPKDATLRGHWISRVNRRSWIPGNHDRLCSDHFESDCVVRSKPGSLKPAKYKLRTRSIPTLFSHASEEHPSSDPGVSTPRSRAKQQDSEIIALAMENQRLRALVAALEAKVVVLSDKVTELESQRDLTETARPVPISALTYKDQDEKFRRLTGLVSHDRFRQLVEVFEAPYKTSQFKCNPTEVPRPDRRKLTCEDQLFMVLLRLRCGLKEELCAPLFHISQATVSKTFELWINLMGQVISHLDTFPSREMTRAYAPLGMTSSGYGDVRIVVDCFEVFCQVPSHAGTQICSFSSYKHHCTIKFLLGVTPAPQISFISEGYLVSITDENSVLFSGLLDLLEPGDLIMADKGFKLPAAALEKQVSLVMPDFLGAESQFEPSEMNRTFNIARWRILVERAIRRIKEFSILSGNVPQNMVPFLTEILKVIVFLVNLSTDVLDTES